MPPLMPFARRLPLALFAAALLGGAPVTAIHATTHVAPPAPRPAPPAPRPPAQATPQILALDRFIRESGPLCERQPAARCVDAGWAHADRDKDGALTLDEVQRVRDELGRWLAWKTDGLSPRERASLGMGLWIADSAGIPAVFASYDADGDGRLTRAELLADVRLDRRPLGRVLSDPQAVDRQAFAKRLGPLAKMAEILMQPRPAPGAPQAAPRPPRPEAQPLPPPAR